MRAVSGTVRLAPFLLLACTLLPSLGCLTSSQSKALVQDVDSIRAQLLQLQKENAAVSAAVAAQAESLAKALEQRDEDQRVGRADLSTQVDAVARQMEALGQKIEDNNFRLSSLSGQMEATRRLLERGGSAGAALPAPAVGDPTTTTAPGPGAPAVPPAGAPPKPGTASPEEIFNTAYADYTKGNFPLAILGFQEYLEEFPGSDFADDARYWIGESYYSQGKFTDAIQAFGECLRLHPKGDKAAAAQLKRGYAYLEANQTTQGVKELNAVVASFPSSDEARLATEKLRSLGLAAPRG